MAKETVVKTTTVNNSSASIKLTSSLSVMEEREECSCLILLSTYNGEKYLRAQLNSLREQTHTNWKLLIRDDGSTDATVDIIKQFSTLDSRIIFIPDTLGNLNVKKSFLLLMQHALNSQEEYIFFCDQDDVWLPEKLTLQLALLQQLQKQYHKETPLLVHSDLHVVNENLETIHRSFLQFEKITRNTKAPLHTLLINNFVTGCTLGMNKALLKLAYPIAENAVMHDWWCALCAAACGQIAFVEQATILYRQHAANTVGSKGLYGKLGEIFCNTRILRKKQANLQLCFLQVGELLSRIPDDNVNYALLNNFYNVLNQERIVRIFSVWRLPLQATSRMRLVVFYVVLLLLS